MGGHLTRLCAALTHRPRPCVPWLQAKRVSWYRHGLDIALDVAQALHFLHSRSIIHFDCKSPNILLSTTNSAKLAGARQLD